MSNICRTDKHTLGPAGPGQARRSRRYCVDIDGRIMNNVCVFAVVDLLVILVRLSFDVGLLCPTSMDILTLASLTPEMIQRQFENVG